MKKLLIFFLITISLSQIAKSQNLTINITGENIGGKTIRLISMEDNLSFLEKEICRITLSSKDSSLSFSTTLTHTTQMTIRIDMYDYNFIAEAGNIYKLRIPYFNFNFDEFSNTLLFKTPLNIIIEEGDKNNLNSKIYAFDSTLENFVSTYKKDILILRNKNILDSLNNIKNLFLKEEDSNSYFYNYVNYSIIPIIYSSNIVSKKKLKTEAFYNRPILYSNIGYMNCFEFIYGNYFTDGNKIFSHKTLDRWFEENNYFALIDSLGMDTLLRNEVFRELVFLRGMKEAFFTYRFDQIEVIKMLEKFIHSTKFKEHEEIAKNIMSVFIKNSFSGLKPKEFTLNTLNEKTITIGKPSNKPLIISFVKLNEPESLFELEALFGFEEKVAKNCNLLTICCDKSLDAMYNFLNNSKVGTKYKWDFAYFDNKWDLLEMFNIKMFPTFILIDKDGYVLQNPMKKPSEGGLLPFTTKKQ